LTLSRQVYLHVQLGNKALDCARPTEAAGHFTAAVNAGTFLTKSAIDSKCYEDFAMVRRATVMLSMLSDVFSPALRV